MTEQNTTTATTAPAAEKAPAKTPAKKPASTTRKASGNGTPAKAKAPAKAPAKSKAAAKPATPAKAKKPAEQGVMATKSGVSHPGPLWLEAMHKQGLSQTACANEMGVAPMTLNRLINGHGIPTARVTLAFAKATKQQPKKVWAQVCDFELALALEQEAAEATSK